MNERIKELADEAAKFSAIMALPTGESGDKLFVEKFAELIAGECAAICDRFQSRDVGMQPAECAGAIRKMFGVQ